MCNPAVIPYVIMAVGTAYGMYTENQAKHYQQDVAKQDKKLADQAAINANAEGSYAADQARIRGNLQRGQQLAAFAANNVDFSTGSAADILGDTAMFSEQDQRQARINASMKAYGFQVQSLEAQGREAYAGWSGRSQQFGQFLQGASQAAGMYASSGGFGGGGSSTPSLSGGSYYSRMGGNGMGDGGSGTLLGNYSGRRSYNGGWG